MDLRFKVISNSMHPLLKIGDELHFVEAPSEPKIFDILIFRRENKLFAHFVWRFQKESRTVITRSFAQLFRDEEPVQQKEILGILHQVRISTWKRFQIVLMNILRGSY